MKKKINLYYSIVLIITLSFFTNAKAQPFEGFMRFDGIDDELRLSTAVTNIFQFNSDFTIEFWFRTCQDTILHHQAFLGNSSNIEINMFPSSPNTYFQLCAKSTDGAWTCNQDHQYPMDLEWHHLAVTYYNSSEEFEFYFDGIDGTLSTSSNYNFTPGGFLYVGRSGNQTWIYDHFNGYMDELRISDTVRYNGSFTPPTNEFSPDTYTKGLWHFNEDNFGDSILDHSGNNFHFFASGNPKSIHLDSLISQTNNTLNVSNTFDSYQWINCLNNNIPIPGETSHIFTPTVTGSYAVKVGEGSCPLTSNCFDFIITGTEKLINNKSITIYPNPTTNQLTIGTELKISEVSIVNITGQTIKTITANLNTINVTDLSRGIYFIKLNIDDSIIAKKFVKH